MDIKKAKRILNDAGYVCVRWNPGDSWSVGHSDEIDGTGLCIELTASEVRSAAEQIGSIYDKHKPSK